MALVEYIWLDGTEPTQLIRSKTRFVNLPQERSICIEDFPEWSFDGSSTGQAEGSDSDCILKPVRFCEDPIRGESNRVVLCEVYQADGKTPHESNYRAELVKLLRNRKVKGKDPMVGFEQEYTLFNAKGTSPLGWRGGEPSPQGPYYCGVGSNHVFGRELVEEHTAACLTAGLMIYGTNAEVMPGQWEFQLGYRGIQGEDAGPLMVSDQLIIARWLLHRLGEKHHIHVSLHPKPKEGNWNGAGMHTNFSTAKMRDKKRKRGLKTIEKAITLLEEKHDEHIAVYGAFNELRLTGEHETAPITEFRSGVADRGASIRIPRGVQIDGGGYLEDRRPASNGCPYQITAALVKTVCEVK